jgi:hypothetical protein
MAPADGQPRVQHVANRPQDVLEVDADEEGVHVDDAAGAYRYPVATNSRKARETVLSGL